MDPEAGPKGFYGVLVMAHGGGEEWNHAVLDAVAPLRSRYPVEVAFGMADAASLQEAVDRLEERGARRIGVVRLFVSGESWYERTRRILGLDPGAPTRPSSSPSAAAAHGHRMEYWRVRTRSVFAMHTDGLADAPEMGRVLADRLARLSRDPSREDVLVLAHGPGDDRENERWLAKIERCLDEVRARFDFRRVRAMTLREDWPDKRLEAEREIRSFVERAGREDGAALVVPFRVHGFGPYRGVLEGLDYVADGVGLLPHPLVEAWIERKAQELSHAVFEVPRVEPGEAVRLGTQAR